MLFQVKQRPEHAEVSWYKIIFSLPRDENLLYIELWEEPSLRKPEALILRLRLL